MNANYWEREGHWKPAGRISDRGREPRDVFSECSGEEVLPKECVESIFAGPEIGTRKE